MTKADLRKLYLEKRRALSATEIDAASTSITERFFGAFDLSAVRVLHTFIPIAKFAELDTLKICVRVWSEFPATTIAVPKVELESGEMMSIAFGRDTELVVNKWGIHEPAADQLIDPTEIDVVLVPGLCFDRRGHRVGYGKGFYDRFLRTTRKDSAKIGLSYFDPVKTISDIHDGDIAVDSVITPNQLFRF